MPHMHTCKPVTDFYTKAKVLQTVQPHKLPIFTLFVNNYKQEFTKNYSVVNYEFTKCL